MMKNYLKNTFRSWLSVWKVAVAVVLMCGFIFVIRYYKLTSAEIAGWVQAVGALVSIWAAWSIARTQGLKAEIEARRVEAAKCAAVVGILEHVRSVINSHRKMGNDLGRIKVFCNDVTVLVSTLDKIDLLSLPGTTFVNAVCSTRQMLESLINSFGDQHTAHMHGIYFEYSHGKEAFSLLDKHIAECRGEQGMY